MFFAPIFSPVTRCNKKNTQLYAKKEKSVALKTPKKIFLPIIGLLIQFVSGEKYFLHRHKSKRYLGPPCIIYY